MSEDAGRQVEPSDHDHDRIGTQKWVRRGVMILVVLVAAFVLYRIAASFLPRWWAQRVADQAGGSMGKGTTWGLFYGFVFTFIPVLVFFQARRKLFNWKAKIAVVVVALILAAPNWLTLVVVAANSNAAHAGERIMDVDAPGFRWATLIGVIVGGVLSIALSSTSMLLSHRRKQVKELKEQVRRGKERPEEGTSESS